MDDEVTERVRAHVRKEIFERKISMSRAAKILTVGSGYLSRVLSGERGFGPGFLKLVHTNMGIHGSTLLDDDPPRRFYVADSWDWRPRGPDGASPPPDPGGAASSAAGSVAARRLPA